MACLQGYIQIPSVAVEKVLGKPNGYRDEKIEKEWNIQIDGVEMSLYYYWDDPDMHVGASMARAVTLARTLFTPLFKEELIQRVFEPRRVERMGGTEWLEVV